MSATQWVWIVYEIITTIKAINISITCQKFFLLPLSSSSLFLCGKNTSHEICPLRRFQMYNTVLLLLIYFYWSIVDLQCVHLCCTAEWQFIYLYVYMYYICVCIHTHTHTHTHTQFLKNALFHRGQWIEFSVLYSGTLLFILSVYSSWHLPTPVSHSKPPPSSQPGQPQVCSPHKSVDLFLFHRFLGVVCWIPHKSDIICYLSFFFWPASFSMTISSCIHVATTLFLLLA